MSRQDLVNFINTIPKATAAVGADKLSAWVRGDIYGVEDKWYAIFQAEGGTQHLANIIACFLNIPSVGYNDFSNKKQQGGDQYRAYVAIAQKVVDTHTGILAALKAQLIKATDPNQKAILTAEVEVEQSTLAAETANLATWKSTLANAITAGQVV